MKFEDKNGNVIECTVEEYRQIIGTRRTPTMQDIVDKVSFKPKRGRPKGSKNSVKKTAPAVRKTRGVNNRYNYTQLASKARGIIRNSKKPLSIAQIVRELGIPYGGKTQLYLRMEIEKNMFGIRKISKRKYASARELGYTPPTTVKIRKSKKSGYHTFLSKQVKENIAKGQDYMTAVRNAQKDWKNMWQAKQG